MSAAEQKNTDWPSIFRKCSENSDSLIALNDPEILTSLELLETQANETPEKVCGLFLKLHSLDARKFAVETFQEPTQTKLRLFHKRDDLPLGKLVAVLESLGLKILQEIPVLFSKASDHPGTIHLITLEKSTLPEKFESLLANFLFAVQNLDKSYDPLSQLIRTAGLTWAECRLLRSALAYTKQLDVKGWPQDPLPHVLAYTELASIFCNLFHARLSPEVAESPGLEKSLTHRMEKLLEALPSEGTQLVWGYLFKVLTATTRTNFYQKESGNHKKYLSLKIACGQIPGLPQPQPMFETFVYSPFMEGTHMRSAKVARGGIRFSNRSDYRQEVLGLMRTQTLKNAIIVPLGSKGGFIKKELSTLYQSNPAPNTDPYCTYIKGLLDITDNIVDGKPIRPEAVKARDNDDTYLVVAADKGTATRSDDANRLSQEYGFWLGDAFASGGSNGYDHKKIGITSKGAWTAVLHHFQRIGVDPNAAFTVAGVGDMSGDVFGNGMLQLKTIKLLAAFDHRHIFIDPDPCPATSFNERSRLFNLPRSSWKDYNPQKLSKGGGIFDRTASRITLSSEAQQKLGLEKSSLTPDELIRAILGLAVDLLWFGGIGTFVRGENEDNNDISDKTNAPLRVPSSHIKARVIGEGANLALTETARIQLNQNGVQLNTDAIDNAAGVTCSDYEVNLKTLLAPLVQQGDMPPQKRNQVLQENQEAIVQRVLETVQSQSEGISITYDQQAELEQENEALITVCATTPSPGQQACQVMAESRKIKQTDLTRPEISVLFAYSKISLYQTLLESPLLNDPFFLKALFGYFPENIQKDFPEAIKGHLLWKEITATTVANFVINRLGPSFLQDLCLVEERSLCQVMKALLIVTELLRWPILDPNFSTTAFYLNQRASLSFRRLVHWALVIMGSEKTIAMNVKSHQDAFNALIDLQFHQYQKGHFFFNDSAVRSAEKLSLIPGAIQLAKDFSKSTADTFKILKVVCDNLGLQVLQKKLALFQSKTLVQKKAFEAVKSEIFECYTKMAFSFLRKEVPESNIKSTINMCAREDVEKLLTALTKMQDTAVTDISFFVLIQDMLSNVLKKFG